MSGAEPTPKAVYVSLARSLGFAVLYYCNEASVIVPTSLVGTAMLLHRDRGISCAKLRPLAHLDSDRGPLDVLGCLL